MSAEAWAVSVLVPIMVAMFGSSWLGDFLAKKREGKITNTEIMDKLTKVDDRLTTVEENIDRNNAITARVRIIRFNDELLEHKDHSKESFDQCLSDIDTYEDYCEKHPEFSNNKTVLSVENILRIYKELEANNGFLKAYRG